MTKYSRIAVYAGTFDPVTNGHLDIIQRSLRLFDQVVVAVAASTPKSSVMFTAEDRRKLISEATNSLGANLEVVVFSGLLVNFVRSQNANVIVRGLRAVSDYEYEAQMALINRELSPEIETVFLMTSEHCSFISSSIVKEIARLGGDISAMVPPNVAQALR